MSGANSRCPICNRGFNTRQKIVRVLAEIAEYDPKEDGRDPDFWSTVQDWDSIVKMHLSCVQKASLEDREYPYESELTNLALFENGQFKIDEPQETVLKLVEGGIS